MYNMWTKDPSQVHWSSSPRHVNPFPAAPPALQAPVAPHDLGELNLAPGSFRGLRGCGSNPISLVFSSDEGRAAPCYSVTRQLFMMEGQPRKALLGTVLRTEEQLNPL